MTVDVLDFFALEDGRVVRVVGESHDRLTLEHVETGERFPVLKAPFEVDVRQGYIQPVEPEFRPVGDEAHAGERVAES